MNNKKITSAIVALAVLVTVAIAGTVVSTSSKVEASGAACVKTDATINNLIEGGISLFGRLPTINIYADDAATSFTNLLIKLADADIGKDERKTLKEADTIYVLTVDGVAQNFLIFTKGNCNLSIISVEPATLNTITQNIKTLVKVAA